MSFSSLRYSNFFANITFRNVTHVCTKKGKTRSFIYQVNLNFLRSLGHFNYYTTFAMIVSLLNEWVHGFKDIGKKRVQTGF